MQPCDSFVMQIIKAACVMRWDAKKARDLLSGNFRDGSGCSGKLRNPGKHYILKLGAEAVHAARTRMDDDGINYARKAVILCGLILNTKRVWRVSQLKKELRQLVRENKDLFESVVNESYDEGKAADGEGDDAEADGDDEDDVESGGGERSYFGIDGED